MATARLITVSQLRCACLDAGWRQRWLKGENPPTFARRTRSEFPTEGALFHTLVQHFTDWLREEAPAADIATGGELWRTLYDRWAQPRLDELLRQGAIPSAHFLSRALENFCHRLAALRAAAGESFHGWSDLFLTHEYALDRIEVVTDHGSVCVSGRPDAVRHAAGQGLEIVDYKLSRGVSLKHDLIQVAAYAHLLRLAKPGLQFTGVLEYYEPALHLTPIDGASLEGLWQEVILPALQELAGGAPPFQPRSPRIAPARVTPPSGVHDEMAARIEETYACFGLRVRVLGKMEGPQLVRYQVEPGPGVKVVSLANRAEDLQVALSLHSVPLVQAAPGCVAIDLPKETPDAVPWSAALARMGVDAPPLSFPLGVGVNGQLLTADFADPNTSHALVAGAAGSGKSEFLKAMVASLIQRNSPDKLRLLLVDPKAVTFVPLAACPHLLRPVLTDLESILAFLDEAIAEMERRYSVLAAAGHEKLEHFTGPSPIPRWVLVFDEFADLILQGRAQKQAFEERVARLAQKGRAAGVHIVLATQRPDRNIVSGLIKSNLPLKVSLRVSSAVNSQIVLDEVGAEKLLGRGDFLCDRGRGLERGQSPFITAEELGALVAREAAQPA